MASPEIELLPIVARVEEAEAIEALSVEKVTAAILADVGPELGLTSALGTSPCDDIEIFSGTEQDVFNRVVQSLCRALEGLTGGAADAVGDLLASASASINGVLGEVEGLVSGMSEAIAQALSDVVDTITDRLDQSLDAIIRSVEGVVSRVSDFVAGVVDTIDRGVAVVLDAIGLAVGALLNSVSNAFGALLEGTANLIGRIDETVRLVGEFLVDLATDTLDAMSRTVGAVLGPLIGAGESVLARLGDVIESVPGAVKDAAGALTEGIGKFVGDPLGSIGSIFVTQVEEFFANMVEEGKLSHGDVIRTLLTRLGAPADVADKIASAADDSAPVTPAPFVLALAFLAPLLIAQFVGTAMTPVGEQMSQEVSKLLRQAIVPPADLVDGWLKGDIPEARLREEFALHGYGSERLDLILKSARIAPDPSTNINAWLRGLIDEDALDRVLAQNRMRPEDVELLKQVVFFVPPAQDLIRMAVREVFSPDVRERFGQDQDFPEEFAMFALQQGISDEWARAYWAAHWALPSPAQGFEMLHRGVIEPEDLDVLLRALDVMPFWRDKMTDIAFSPLTRVDLRRMHALGLLTDKELQTRYEAIGFSADDAAFMVTFTVAFNASQDSLPEELEGLTRASILNMFEDGLITRDDAVPLLASMGIGEDAAELFVEQRELEVSRRDRNNLIESIVALAGGGRISLPQAEDSLAQIGISAIEITRAVGRIIGKRDERDRLPTIAELTKMHSGTIIDDAVFLDTLKALGFDDTWAAREFTLITGEAPTSST